MSMIAAAAALLAGCGERPSNENVVAGPQPLPPMPDWAQPLIGQPLDEAFPNRAACLGHIDAVETRHETPRVGATLGGWGWDPVAARPIARVIIVDGDGRIVGAGVGGRERPDVPQAMPQVTSNRAGWTAVALGRGEVDAYGVLSAAGSLCKLQGDRVL